MYEAAFNPNDISFITCLGNKVFRCYRLQDNKLKLVHSQINGISSEVSQEYTCHAWLTDGNVIIGTATGELILLNNNCEFQTVLPESPFNDWRVESITVYSKGFIVGGEGLKIFMYERDLEGDSHYKRIMKEIQVSKVGRGNGKLGSLEDNL